MSTLHRAQILLKTEQHQALSEMAKREGRSLSDLVREIVQRHLDREQSRRQHDLDIIDSLSQTRQQLQACYGMLESDPVASVREEREQDVERVWSDDPCE
jgi:hypothetical protein